MRKFELQSAEARYRPDYKSEPIMYKNAPPQRKEAVATKTSAIQKKIDTKLQGVAKGKTSDSRRQREELQNEKDDTTNDADKKESEQEIEDMFPLEVSEGTKELDAQTTKMLEYELRHIMIKVWQEFPDHPATDEEKLVAEKFRNEAGDDLRNVIGLNVTKRLLNVHNRLIVKVRFSNRPEKGYLLAFLKKYRIRGFKRVSAETNTFAAQLKTIEDFDRICSEKEISCGTAKLTITPCYKFMKRPPNLKSKFVDDTDDEITDELKETKEKLESKQGPDLKKKTGMKANSDNNQNEKTLKSVKESTNLQEQKNSEYIKQQSVKTACTKPDEGTTNKKPTNVSNTQKVTDKSSTVFKETATKTSMSNPQNEKKLVQSKADETVTKIADKSVDVKNNENKAAITKTIQNAQNAPRTQTTMKAQNKATESVQKVQGSQKVVKKPEIKPNVIKNVVQRTPKTTPLKKQTTKTVQKTPVPKNKSQVKGKNTESKASIKENKSNIKKDSKKGVIDKYDDYDEMDDEDILALLSEGVVLDECGSDEE